MKSDHINIKNFHPLDFIKNTNTLNLSVIQKIKIIFKYYLLRSDSVI